MSHKDKAPRFPKEMERDFVREAAGQFASALSQALRLIQVEQMVLLLDIGYDGEGRAYLVHLLADNLLHSGVTGISAGALQEAVGSVLLGRLLFTLLFEGVDEISAHIQAVTLLERNLEFKNYVRHHPPVTLSTRRERIGPTSSSDPDTDVSDVPQVQRAYYSRAVESRTGRSGRRTGWRQPGGVYEP